MATLITGATGLIGARLARERADAGESVHALCRTGSNTTFLEHENITIIRGDVTNAHDVERAMDGCDEVYHLAEFAHTWAPDRTVFERVNVGGLQHVITAAAPNPSTKIVFSSTRMTLAPSDDCAADEFSSATAPVLTEYARSKVAAEALAQRAADRGIHIVIVQPTRMFGPGPLTETNAVTRLVRNYLAGTWRVMPGSGECVANYAFVDDIVRGMHCAMMRGRAGERYLLGGENATYLQFFGTVANICGQERWMFGLPRSMAMAFAGLQLKRAQWTKRYPLITPEWTDAVMRHWACTSEKAQRELGYIITPMSDALAATIRWIETLALKEGALA